jgi:hypothetical protein
MTSGQRGKSSTKLTKSWFPPTPLSARLLSSRVAVPSQHQCHFTSLYSSGSFFQLVRCQVNTNETSF